MPTIPAFSCRLSPANLRRKGAVLFVLAIALYGVWRSFMSYAVAPDTGMLSQEAILMSDLERRLVPLRGYLSVDQAYGYITAQPQQGALSTEYRYTMARYILAPTIVFDDPDLPLLIVDLPDDATLEAYVQRQGLTVIHQPVPAAPGVAIATREKP